MFSLAKKEISSRELVYLFLVLIMSFLIQVAVIEFLSKYALLLLILLILFLTSIILYFGYLKDFSVYLLVVNFFPLLLLDNNIHYDFHLEMISFIPLLGLALLGVCLYLLNESDISLKMSYLELPVIALVAYFGLSAVISLTQGRTINGYWLNSCHFCLYMLIFPVLYLLNIPRKIFSGAEVFIMVLNTYFIAVYSL